MTKTTNKNSKQTKLIFGKGNAKLDKSTAIFSLPAGHSCPGALECLAKVNRATGKLSDGENTVFRCYATAAEYMFPNVRRSRWNNFEALKSCKGFIQMADLIESNLPSGATRVRIHQSGDFFSQNYFDAWTLVAERNPQTIFYAYTKALMYWVSRIKTIPANFKLTASRGGRFDDLIDTYGRGTNKKKLTFSPKSKT